MSPSLTIRMSVALAALLGSRAFAADLTELTPAPTVELSHRQDPQNQAELPYFDLDAHLDQQSYFIAGGNDRRWQLLPGSLIYKSYLAGVKESRLGTQLYQSRQDDQLWDATLGARVGILRYGNEDPVLPQGIQVDVEGSAQVRLDYSRDVDVRSTDYRAGIPITFGYGRHQTKLAYYHMSSHLGDEFLLQFPSYPRLNWSRDAFVLGHSIYLTERWRVYAEAGWAFHSEVAELWEFQFGTEWAPATPTGFHGAPFFAINGHLREELDYAGNLSAQAGWSWLSNSDRRLLRIGFYYYNGKSSQNSFYDNFESHVGTGLWYDF